MAKPILQTGDVVSLRNGDHGVVVDDGMVFIVCFDVACDNRPYTIGYYVSKNLKYTPNSDYDIMSVSRASTTSYLVPTMNEIWVRKQKKLKGGRN